MIAGFTLKPQRISNRSHSAALLSRVAVAIGMALSIGSVQVLAQAYPSKPVKLVVPFPAGGSADALSRLLAQDMSGRMGQPIVIENRGGAGGMVGSEYVAKSPADGYTLVSYSSATPLAMYFAEKPFDFLKDFAPIGNIYDVAVVLLVNPQMLPNVTNLQQFIAHAKANPGMNYTSTSHGSMGHLTTERLGNLAGFRMQHVAYKGGAPAIADVLGGQLPVIFPDFALALPHIRSGKLRALAISSAARSPQAPEIPTIAEQGFSGFEAVPWLALAAPAGTARDITNRLTGELRTSVASADIQQRIRATGAEPNYMPPDAFAKRVTDGYLQWTKVVKDNDIKAP
jgi:tripartite-type tricarboxylate transporter receptor subunit TctC